MNPDDLMRLRELRDNLEWFEQHACQKPGKWTQYRINVETTRNLVLSEIRRTEKGYL